MKSPVFSALRDAAPLVSIGAGLLILVSASGCAANSTLGSARPITGTTDSDNPPSQQPEPAPPQQ